MEVAVAKANDLLVALSSLPSNAFQQSVQLRETLEKISLRISELSIEMPSEQTFTITTSQIGGRIGEWSSLKTPYDEIYAADGSVRPPYQQVIKIIQKIEQEAPQRIDDFPAKSTKDFSGDNRLYHIPRMLSINESDLISKGVQQRGRAFQQFIIDHFSPKSRYQKDKILPKLVLKQLVSRNNEQKVEKISKRIVSNWSFWYGPDILRGPDGRFFVCEDNLGYVGGIGDLVCARRSLLSSFPEYKETFSGPKPKEFYQSMMQLYQKLLPSPDDKIVMLHYPYKVAADNEEKRVINLFHRYGGVVPVCLTMPGYKSPNSNRLLIRRDGTVEVEYKEKGSQQVVVKKVGVVIVNAEPFDVDPRHSVVKRKMIIDECNNVLHYYNETIKDLSQKKGGEGSVKHKKKIRRITEKRDELQKLMLAPNTKLHRLTHFLRTHRREDLKDLLKQGIPGLLDSYYQGKVHLSNGPGFDFLGDKLFCVYVDALIRYYLKEEPILSTIPTYSFGCFDKKSTKSDRLKKQERKGNSNNNNTNGSGIKQPSSPSQREGSDSEVEDPRADMELVQEVFGNAQAQDRVVIKKVDGRGGDSVWVGPKLTRAEFMAVKDKVLSDPQAFIVQQYLPISTVDGHIVDIRNLSCVTSSEVLVSRTLWGRGVPLEGNGKVNISDHGFEFAICSAKV